MALHILDSMPGQVPVGTYRIPKIRLEDATADVQMDRQVGNLAHQSRFPGEGEGRRKLSSTLSICYRFIRISTGTEDEHAI